MANSATYECVFMQACWYVCELGHLTQAHTTSLENITIKSGRTFTCYIETFTHM